LREYPEYGRKQIADILQDISEDGVKYHMEKLKAEGKIKRIGPDKGGRWEILI
jgi:ATP-dependent DNA helicase RecG